jgi:hypothetical protein
MEVVHVRCAGLDISKKDAKVFGPAPIPQSVEGARLTVFPPGLEGTMSTCSVPERHYWPTRANRLATTGAE